MNPKNLGAAFVSCLPKMILKESSTLTSSRPQASIWLRSVVSESHNHHATSDIDDTIITPHDRNTLHNFGPASSRDFTLYTCERPGGDPENGSIPVSAVEEWAHFMRVQGINEVLVLLDDIELACYQQPGLLNLYEKFGFRVHRNPMNEAGASTRAMATISDCHANNKKIVTHCTHGQGRAGRVAAAWLVHQYGLSAEDATKEALDMAIMKGVTRMGSPSKLKAWLENV